MGQTKRNIVVNERLDIKDTTFGNMISLFNNEQINEVIKDCDVIIVMRNSGGGLIPFKLLLPHQLYTRTLEEELKKYSDIKSFTVVAVNSKNYIDVAKVELEYIPDNVDALMKEKEMKINCVKGEIEDAIADLKSDMECDIAEVERIYDERIKQAIDENKRLGNEEVSKTTEDKASQD